MVGIVVTTSPNFNLYKIVVYRYLQIKNCAKLVQNKYYFNQKYNMQF